ncbi:caprin homolog isoform X2 [Daphnia pulex]|uniref:caprin homolog isoform X2 n=1 Tax=Daphnia pulex TaxID=6669 RepID=UPI001EDFC802|nr:caprin homolog isoform X2 [Daphnia pulex]
MPSIASNNTSVKVEKVSVLDLPESFKSANTVIEKKCRNLEKRKIRLDGYREELARGKGLSEEQQRATDRYDEVVANLELTKEFLTAFEKIGSETSKEEKKRKKKEIFERQQYELSRFKELFTIQEIFNCLCSPSAREDFLNGLHGSPQLTESDLQKLDTFYSLISIDRQNLPKKFNDAVANSATHFQHLMEGRNKEVAGSTYRELKDLVFSIINNGYFDWKAPPEVEPEPVEPEIVEPVMEKSEAFQTTHMETVYQNMPDEPTYVETGMEYIEPQVSLPIQPQVVPQAAAYFPVDIDTDFNFIQESMIDAKPVLPTIPASVPMPIQTAAHVPVSLASMDSAVVMVHSQMPHLAYPHYAASMYAAHAAPLVPGPPSMQLPTTQHQQQQQPPPQQMHQQQQPSNDLPIESVIQENPAPLTAQVEAQENRATASSPWAEEPQDDIPAFQQDQSRNESNTWTNSNYRSNDQGTDGRRGGYRGRGNGGPRGGSRGGGSGYYNNSRGGYGGGDRQGNGERNYQNNDRHQGNGGDRNGMERGSYQGGERSYQSNNGGGRYQGNNGERNYNQGGSYRSSGDRGNSSYAPRGNSGGYRGGPPRGAPRGSSRGSGGNYDGRNTAYAKE